MAPYLVDDNQQQIDTIQSIHTANTNITQSVITTVYQEYQRKGALLWFGCYEFFFVG